jgi:hypothetical protein
MGLEKYTFQPGFYLESGFEVIHSFIHKRMVWFRGMVVFAQLK